MSTVTVRPGGFYEKDTNEERVILFDWDAENLATSVEIDTSTWVITAERPTGESPVALDSESESIVTGNRKTQALLTGGTLGTLYRVTNRITTDETPAQVKERSVFVQIVNQ